MCAELTFSNPQRLFLKNSSLDPEWSGAHQIGGEEGLEVEEQPGTGDLLQPTAAGFLSLL